MHLYFDFFNVVMNSIRIDIRIKIASTSTSKELFDVIEILNLKIFSRSIYYS